MQGVAVLASDQSSDGDDVDPLPPFVSLSYSAGHNVVPDKKSSPAVSIQSMKSVNTDFSRDSGFSTDTTFPSPPQQLKPASPYEVLNVVFCHINNPSPSLQINLNVFL